REILQEYVNTVIFRDVIERHQISNTQAVKFFLVHCLQNPSSSLSITKLHRALKSNGLNVGKNALYEYLSYFEEAYLLFTVPIYDLSLRRRQVNPNKLYVIDTGIISAYAVNPLFILGPRFENAVYLQLRRKYQEMYYYKTATNKEIDFVAVMPNNEL